MVAPSLLSERPSASSQSSNLHSGAPQTLTSFGFLRDETAEQEGQYGIGQLFEKVKTVFSGAPQAKESEPQTRLPFAEGPVKNKQIVQAKAGQARPGIRASSLAVESQGLGAKRLPVGDIGGSERRSISSFVHPVAGSSATNGAEGWTPQRHALATRTTAVNSPSSNRKDAFNGPSMGKSRAPMLHNIPSDSTSKPFPNSLKPPKPAPAVTSTVPTHAMSYHASISSLADLSGDTASVHRRGSGDDNGDGSIGSIGALRDARRSEDLPWSAIPGFPLSRDILADDAQSVRSSTSRRQGTEISGEHAIGDSSSSSLQMSAEAFRRLTMKGGAAQSREWWMPDASAKECSSCGSMFTVARRRHHCRCCGQIFCAKCASNLLPGSRLGISGVVRICNFCTNMLVDYDQASSGVRLDGIPEISRDADGKVRTELISAPLEAAVKDAPQGRFAANALFGATALGRDSLGDSPRSPSLHRYPSNEVLDDEENYKISAQSTDSANRSDAPAPFRRGLAEEDRFLPVEASTDSLPEPVSYDDTLQVSPHDEDIVPTGAHDASTIEFPSAEAKGELTLDKVRPRNILDEARARLASDTALSHESRARLVSEAAIHAFRRSRLRSRVTVEDVRLESPMGVRDDVTADGRPGSRSGHHNLHELSGDGSTYLRRLCSQSLEKAEIPCREKWLDVLVPLTIKVVQHIHPAPQAYGDNMGVRRFIKIKRIPGGSIDDCHLTSGYICSRNVAAKSMLRRLPLKNSRVILLAFPLTAVKSDGHYLSLETLSASEREYTRILVGRVLSLRPHLLVIKDQVSRLALDMLDEAGVVVVCKVPESSLAAIARVTQAEIVTSADRLALRPRLGRCGAFSVDTYHSGLYSSKRRSFLRFSGTAKQLGCSFILRGGGQELLGKVKAVLELLLLAAHNLRLEESMRDASLSLLPVRKTHSKTLYDCQTDEPEHETLAELLPGGVDSTVISALRDHEATLLSISTQIDIPPPYPLIRLQQQARALRAIEKEMQLKKEGAAESDTPASETDHKAASLSETEETPDADAEAVSPNMVQNDDAEDAPSSPNISAITIPAKPPSDGMKEPTLYIETDVAPKIADILPSEQELELQTRCALANSRHDTDARYLIGSLRDASRNTPFAHQRLPVLHTLVSSATMRACEGPRVEQIEFYGHNDQTISSYLDTKCASSSTACKSKGCGLQRILHFDSYVHHDVRVQIFCERFVCPIAGQETSLLTWEYCKVCEAATPVSIVHEVARAYSWAKFLEAHFYTLEAAAECPHNSLTDRIRYFAYKNLAFRLHVEQIYPLEIVVPGLQLFMRPDVQSKLKSEETMALARRSDCYFHSVAARLKALEHELSLGRDGTNTVARYSAKLQKIREMALNGRQAVNELMLSTVAASSPQDTLCLNRIRRRLQGFVVNIDRLFGELEKDALPKERDVRRLTASHLSRLFVEKDAIETGEVGQSAALPPAAEIDETPPADEASVPRTESSVSLLARVADSAGLGVPPYVGLADESYTSSISGLTTPTAAHGSISQRSSSRPSAVPTPTTDQSDQIMAIESSPETRASLRSKFPDPATSKTDKLEHRHRVNDAEPAAAMSLLPPRPRPRKAGSTSSVRTEAAKMPAIITDSSCAEAGDVTDSSAFATSLADRLEKGMRNGSTSRIARKGASGDRSVSSNAAVSTTSSDVVKVDDGPSRPSSPHLSQQARSKDRSSLRRQPASTPEVPKFGAVQKRSCSTSQYPHSRVSGRPPPSSYVAPVIKTSSAVGGRASESESDAGSLYGRRRFALTPMAADRQRPQLSRRASGKSDSGSESVISTGREARRRLVSPTTVATARAPMASASSQGPSRVPLPTANTRNRVSTIAKHFNRINREAEREREKQRRALAIRARRALPISASTARVAEYSSVTAAVESDESSSDEDDRHSRTNDGRSDGGEEADSEPEDGPEREEEGVLGEDACTTVRKAASDHPNDGSEATIKAIPAIEPADSAALCPARSSQEEEAVAAAVERALPSQLKEDAPAARASESLANEKGSLLKTISSLWASRPGASLPLLEYPLTGEQHLFADSPLLLRDDEPSSLIAFTLVSTQYQERLHSVRASREEVGIQAHDADASMASWNIVENADQEAQVETSLRRPEGVHLRFDFESGASRFHCRILFAEQFDALRRCCGCSDSIISSLARCVKWDSSGGKSGMTFLKTRDDRLVLKQLSSAELTSFSTFAPHYFAHMAECLMHGKPTTLAKIFGLYRISMRNQATNKSYKLDVLVMENLFYGRQCTRIFDLKGSMRNRYVTPTGAPGEVLLDENLVEISLQKPLYIRESSKAVLRQALKHDSDFLAEMNIMDYSVIVGVDMTDSANRELVVGIIDFLRSYTWDKRVETFVKEQSSLLGAAKGELPTVITPKQYANRFLTFLDTILLLSPDSWYKEMPLPPEQENPPAAS